MTLWLILLTTPGRTPTPTPTRRPAPAAPAAAPTRSTRALHPLLVHRRFDPGPGLDYRRLEPQPLRQVAVARHVQAAPPQVPVHRQHLPLPRPAPGGPPRGHAPASAVSVAVRVARRRSARPPAAPARPPSPSNTTVRRGPAGGPPYCSPLFPVRRRSGGRKRPRRANRFRLGAAAAGRGATAGPGRYPTVCQETKNGVR